MSRFALGVVLLLAGASAAPGDSSFRLRGTERASLPICAADLRPKCVQY